MRKLIFIPLPLALLIALVGFVYFKYFSIKVLPGEKAVIIENGVILDEPLLPGLHSINPFTQKTEIVDVEMLRNWQGEFGGQTKFTVKVLWKIGSVIMYYKQNIGHQVDEKIAISFENLKDNFSKTHTDIYFMNLAKSQSENYAYIDAYLQIFIDQCQSEVDTYGIQIHNIFLKIQYVAQPDAPQVPPEVVGVAHFIGN